MEELPQASLAVHVLVRDTVHPAPGRSLPSLKDSEATEHPSDADGTLKAAVIELG